MDMIIHGDSIDEMNKLSSRSVDLLVTDPPYGYSFMGKNWDKAVPSVEIWKECLRVLKPGGFAFVMSAPRQDVLSQMIVRIGAAGFDTNFTSLYWTYATGFPKAANIGKMMMKRLGRNRKGIYKCDGSYAGFQPKPAVEVIIVAMKPLSEKTFVDQALRNGKGVTWLDDCRIPANSSDTKERKPRFPANLLVSDGVLKDHSRYFDLEAWADTLPFLITRKASKNEKDAGLDHLPIRRPDTRTSSGMGTFEQKGVLPGRNFHPTVKPLTLMSYLITLGSKEGDTVLEPFMGSGTTCLAAQHLNRRYIGIEREKEYVDIALARLKARSYSKRLTPQAAE